MALTLNRADREEIISTLVTNCGGWDEEDIELLAGMGDEKLFAHVQNCADLVTNEDIDDSGLPGTLDPSSAQELESEADDEGWEEEQVGTAPQGTGGPPTGTPETQKQDQPKICHDEDGNEIECPEGESSPGGENVTENEYLGMLPPRIRSVVINALKFENEQKSQFVGMITTNSSNRFNPDYLMTKPLKELELIADLAQPRRQNPQMYIGANGGPVINQEAVDRDDILTVPVLEFN